MNEFIRVNSHFPIFSLLKWPSLTNCYVHDAQDPEQKLLYEDKYTVTSFGLTNKIIPM